MAAQDETKSIGTRQHRSTELDERSSRLPVPRTTALPLLSDDKATAQAKLKDAVRRPRRLTNVEGTFDRAAASIASHAVSAARIPAKLQRRRTQPPRVPPRLQPKEPPSISPKRTGLWVAYQAEKAKRQKECEQRVAKKAEGTKLADTQQAKGRVQPSGLAQSTVDLESLPEATATRGYESDDTVRQTPLRDGFSDAGPSKKDPSKHIAIAEDISHPKHTWTIPPQRLKVAGDVDLSDTTASSLSSAASSPPAEDMFTPPTDELRSRDMPAKPSKSPAGRSGHSSPYYQRWFAGDLMRPDAHGGPALVLSQNTGGTQTPGVSAGSTPSKQTRARKEHHIDLILSPSSSLRSSLPPSLPPRASQAPSTPSPELRPAPLRVSPRRNTIMSEPYTHAGTQTSLMRSSPASDPELDAELSPLPAATYPWLSLSLVRQIRQTFKAEFAVFQKQLDERLTRIEERLEAQQNWLLRPQEESALEERGSSQGDSDNSRTEHGQEDDC